MIRPATDADLPRMAELLGQNMNEPFSVDTLREMRETFPADGFLTELVDEVDGTIRCFGTAFRWPQEPSGRLKMRVHTDVTHRRQGLGRAMFEALPTHEATDLRTEVRDDDEESLAFATRRGFRRKEHIFESSLELDGLNLAPFWEAVERAEAKGIQFFAFADTPMGDDDLWRLYDVNMATALDIPGSDPEVPPFEAWRDMVKGGTWFEPAGQFVAAAGDEWVGIGAVGPFAPGRYYNLMTGVRREWRGCGIASALKLLGIRYAQLQGGSSIRTNNHSENGPMLTINRRLGYVPDPGWYGLRREKSL